jgi:two-component system CheB/CheR fusion protein
MPTKKKETKPKRGEKATSDIIKKRSTLSKGGKNKFPIVGIGASAGGLEALEAFFSHMPSDANIAFVVIQHLSPKHKSIMGSLLAKYTQMEVLELKDGMKVEPNRVYLNPPDKNVIIIEDLGEKAICIILSGTATDGTLGLKTVKGEGGIAMVQDPDSAKYDGMPRSAVATGIVDFILPVEKIPDQLVKYIQAPYVALEKRLKATDEKFANHSQKIFALIRTTTGHDFSHYKQTTIRRRIERRLAVHQIEKMSSYVEYLQKNEAEINILFKDMLIGVTNFFRDPKAFKSLKEQVLPALLKARQPETAIRVWVVGCSTGEEAYSMSIVFSEAMELLRQHFNIQIFASDIDTEAIERARLGVYPDSIAADVSKDRLKRFFVKEENTYRVKKQLRETIVFAVQNVIKDPPFSKIDLLSCRNLLIYMDAPLQKKVLPLCHYTLNTEGVLFLGTSESIGEFTDLFAPIDRKWKIFKRKEFFVERALDYSTVPFYHGSIAGQVAEKRLSADADIHSLAEKVILEDYAPPGVLVNAKFEIVHFMGKTDRYLETPIGKASFNILKMAREGLRFKLSTALHNAVRQKKTTQYDAVRIKHNGEFRIVDLTVRPLTEMKDAGGFMLVMFDDRTSSEQPASKKRKKTIKEDSDPMSASLEKELESTKEHLQTTIEEMETSNEELKSTNEELQSVNEELQSTNEELETSKEELQSTNEELVTVNTELQNKVDELSQANNDINNLLASTDIGTVFLDTDLRIKRFTPTMTKIINLISTDIGRPVSDITSKLRYVNIERDSKEVLDTLIHKEVETKDDQGKYFTVRISPYRTTENVIDGLVITFLDATRVKDGEKARRLAAVVRDSNDAITVQNFDGNITAWNKGAERMYGWSEDEALKMNISQLVPKGKKKEALSLAKRIEKGDKIESIETKRMTKDGKVLNVWMIVTELVDDDGRPVEIATTERDISFFKK